MCLVIVLRASFISCNRPSSLQTASGEALALIGVMRGREEWESLLHEIYAADRIRGEWFNLSPELASFINIAARPILGFENQMAAWKDLLMHGTSPAEAHRILRATPFGKIDPSALSLTSGA